MIGPILVECTECKKNFLSSKIKTKNSRRDDGISEVWYRCPYCKHRYVICLHSDGTLELQKKITRLDKRGKANKARELRLELKRELDLLNGRTN